ncbi:MAG TPA: hypothetical protein VF395_01900, partial [Polyangiaceae bacterium]
MSGKVRAGRLIFGSPWHQTLRWTHRGEFIAALLRVAEKRIMMTETWSGVLLMAFFGACVNACSG